MGCADLAHEQTRVGTPIGSDTRLLLYRNIGMTPDEETLVYRYRLATTFHRKAADERYLPELYR
jgi:hypothetical protein